MKNLTAVIASLLVAWGCATGAVYKDLRSYSDGLAAAQDASGKWGFLNEKQNWAIDAKFEEVRDFQNGRAAAKLNGKWGFINKRGDWL